MKEKIKNHGKTYMNFISRLFKRAKIAVGIINLPYPLSLPDELTKEECISCGGKPVDGRCIMITDRTVKGKSTETLWDVSKIKDKEK